MCSRLTPTARGGDDITFRAIDTPAVQKSFRRQAVRCGYFRDFLRQESRAVCLKLMRQLCSGGIAPGLLAQIKSIFLSAPVPAPVVRAATELCPACNMPFSAVIERYYHCGKGTNPYNIYECRQCKDQGRVGEYSDMKRLRRDGNRLFAKLTDDIRLAEWVRKYKNKKPYWILNARGQTWTRCNQPTCRALYKYYRGKSLQRTVQKHKENISKILMKPC